MAQRVAGAPKGRTNLRFLLVAVLLAGLSAALVYAKISANDTTTAPKVAAGDVQVVVAKAAIKQRTTITADMLEVKSVPANTAAAGAFINVPDVVGKVTKFPIELNQQVIASAVVDTTRPVIDAQLSQVVPTGKRAVSISASQVSNVGGLVLPGDWVDVVWTCCDRAVVTKVLLRNVQVAAVAQAIVSSGPVAGLNPAVNGTPGAGVSSTTGNPVAADPGKPTPDASTVTLLLSPDEAQQVILAEGNGKLRFTLRGFGDQDISDTPQTLITQLLPVEALQTLPDALKPDGYKR